jgi:hypothetical protein
MESIEQARELPLRSSNTPSKYTIWRCTALGAIIAIEVTFGWIVAADFRIGWGARVSVCAALAIAAMAMAFLSARSFGRGQTARRSWLIIGCLGLVDTALFATYLLPGLSAAQTTPAAADTVARSGAVVLGGTALSMLSRFMLAYVLWTTAGVYRKSGLKFHFYRRDYAVVAVLILLAVVSLVYSSAAMRVQLPRVVALAPQLMLWFNLAELARLFALACCSVFGVVVWRYATEMGGGLVAKAWRSVLLYAAIYLLRFAYTGVISHLVTTGSPSPALRSAFIIGLWGLILSEYMLFLGASYQYEACSSHIEVPQDLDVLASQLRSA